MDFNVVKGELKIKIENSGDKTVNKAKRDVVNQKIINNNITITDEQIRKYIPEIKNMFHSTLIKEIKKYPADLIIESFKTISPNFILAYSTPEVVEIQVKALIANNHEISLRRQSIQKLSLLNKRDITIFMLICKIHILITKISNMAQPLSPKNEYEIETILNSILNLKEKILKDYGNINFKYFESIINQGLISYEQGTWDTTLNKFADYQFKNQILNDKMHNSFYKLIKNLPTNYGENFANNLHFHGLITNLGIFIHNELLTQQF